jgi:hypothetical protein
MVNRMKKLDRITSGIAGASRNLLGKELSRAISGAASNQVKMAGSVPMVAMKNGSKGTIKRRVQPALLHKGEVVLTAGQVKSLKKLLK